MNDLYEIPACRTIAEALTILSGVFGAEVPAEVLVHGLSVIKGNLSPVHYTEAAKRAGLKLSPIEPGQATPSHCPLLFCHPDGRAVIIVSVKPTGHAEAYGPQGRASVLLASLSAGGYATCYSVGRLTERDIRTETATADDFSWFRRALFIGMNDLWPVVLATVVINLLALAVPLISMTVFDRVLSHAAFETLWVLSIGGLLAVVAEFVLRNLRSELIDRASARSDVHLSNGVMRRVVGARLTGKSQSVGVQANSLREYEALREIYNSSAIAALGDLPFAILFMIILWAVAGELAIVPLIATPLILCSAIAVQWKLSKLSKEHFKDMAHKSAVAVEVLGALTTLKSHAGESWAAYKWESAVASHLKHSVAMRHWSSVSSHVIIAMQSLTTIALLITGVYLVTAGSISPGALFAASMLTGRCLGPVSQVAGLIGKAHTAKSAYSAIRQITSVEQERPEQVQLLAGPGHPEPIAFESVNFSYLPNGAAVLKDVSLVIKPGEKVGIMGGIGSGKSSFLQLLLGLRRPDSGSVTMGGVPIGQIDPARYRKLFGVGFHGEELFFGSIVENVSFHRPEATEDEILAAVKLSGALDWIKSFPSGLSSIVSEGGRNLSSGQRQTLSLARAFLANPPILCLDEPTSNLDMRNELEFVRHLRALPPETTLIAVSHRVPVLEACDRLIVFDGGRVVLDGERTVVLARLKQLNRIQRPASAGAAS